MSAPCFAIVIGADGAGKTTWCLANRDELPVWFYDADSLARGLGNDDDPALGREARALVNARIDRHLERLEDFGFESTYSGASKPRIARRARELGYATYAVFVGTRDPCINIRRVEARVIAHAGHGVPESEVRRQWITAQENLMKTASVFDRIRILDNSGDHTWTVADYIDRDQHVNAPEPPAWAEQQLMDLVLTRAGFRGQPPPSS